MVIVKLIGGLGNQMFTYAAGFALAKYHDVPLKIDNLYYADRSKRRFHRFEYRPFALDVFNISGKIATEKEISLHTIPRIGNKYLYHLKCRILRKNYNVFNESQCPDYASLIQCPQDTYLEGLFQKYDYLRYIENEIKKEFSFTPPRLQHAVIEHIRGVNSVCVVFRRGDYVGHPFLDIVNMDYYYEAVNLLKAKIGDFSIFVFSDDIQWCKQNFHPDSVDVHFVNQNLTGEKGKDYLYMMTQCKHFIIPNSTYPYWAAFLCSNKNKIVIAPMKWYKGQDDVRNSKLPPDWITV
jgi:hypothetical protein